MKEDLRLFVGTGVEGMRPVGYTTIDISPDHGPDIVADAASLPMIADGSASEFHASHVLEHFSWPRALLVLNEWARVLKVGGTLKVAVPDMSIYAHLLLSGQNTFNVMHDIYGGHFVQEGGPQGHHFGWTRRMLVQVLYVLGFDDFSFWKSDLPEASNTWAYGENQEKIGISLNLAGVKKRPPLLDIEKLAHHIRYHDIRESFMVLVRKNMVDQTLLSGLDDIDAALFQKLNYQYLEASHMSEVWKNKYNELAAKNGSGH